MTELSERWIGKYMRMAKQVGEDCNPCHSRKIGVVLVRGYEGGGSKLLATGFNGPPRGTPHPDTREYLEEVFIPALTVEEEQRLYQRFNLPCDTGLERVDNEEAMLVAASQSRCCPRKLIGCASGQRLELCSCEHAERNAIYNASCDLHGAVAFCWCPVPCWDCTKALVQAGIRLVYCLADGLPDYSPGSRWLFSQAKVDLVTRPAQAYLAVPN